MSLDFEKGDHSGFILPSAIERVGAHEPCRRQPLDPCDLELKIADPIIRFEKTEIAALVRTLSVLQRARLHAETGCSTGAAVPIRKVDAHSLAIFPEMEDRRVPALHLPLLRTPWRGVSRSEERRVGKECVRPFRFRVSPYP